MRKLRLSLVPLLLILAACGSIGAIAPKAFSDKVAAGYASIAVSHDMAATLLDGRVISSADSMNIDKQLETAREGINIARTLTGLEAENRLDVALAAIDAAKAYLCGKQPSNPNCIKR